jgi:DNA primase
LKDWPVTLKRYPDGVHGEFFYEKDTPSYYVYDGAAEEDREGDFNGVKSF